MIFLKIYLREKGAILLTFIVFYMIIQFVTFRWVDFSIFPQSFFLDFLFALGVGSIAFLFRSNKASIIYISVVLSFVMTLFLVNATMYSVYFDLFTLQQLSLLTEATNVFQFEFISIPSILIAVVIIFIYLLVLHFLWKKMYRYYEYIPFYYKKTAIILSIIALFITSFFISGIKTFDRYNRTINITTFKRASLEQYGMLGYYLKEAKVMVFGAKLPNHSGIGGDLIPVEESIPTDFHGLLENANIITIMVESLQSFAVNEYLTPNLYKMMNEGLYFGNNYSENKTNVSEMIGMTGNYPTVQLLPQQFTYDFSHSLPSILSNLYGYRTAYYHDNIGSFYSRERLMKSVGFEKEYYHFDLFPGVPRWTWDGDYTLDSVTVEKVLENMNFKNGQFYYYWSTLSMHGPYNYGPINKQLFTDLGYFAAIDQASEVGLWVNPLAGGALADRMRIRHYQAAVMDFDVALGRLLEELEKSNVLDNTILVLFGDHNVYYHDLHLRLNNADGTQFYRTEMYEAFMAFYNPTLVSVYKEMYGTNVIEKFSSPYNIVPTLFDLLGMTYNQKMMLGESIFSDHNEVFYSNKLTGFFDNYLYSNDGYEVHYYNGTVSYDYIEAFLAVCEEQRDRLEIINYWYNETKESRR